MQAAQARGDRGAVDRAQRGTGGHVRVAGALRGFGHADQAARLQRAEPGAADVRFGVAGALPDTLVDLGDGQAGALTRAGALQRDRAQRQARERQLGELVTGVCDHAHRRVTGGADQPHAAASEPPGDLARELLIAGELLLVGGFAGAGQQPPAHDAQVLLVHAALRCAPLTRSSRVAHASGAGPGASWLLGRQPALASPSAPKDSSVA